MIWAPVSSISSGWSALIVAFVPTGMKVGVSTTPCGRWSRPSRARVEPSAGGATRTSKWAAPVTRSSRLVDGDGETGFGTGRRCSLPEAGLAHGPSRGHVVAEGDQVRPRAVRRHPSLRGPVQEADPEQVRLVDVHDRLDLLGEDRPARRDADRPAPELHDDRGEQAPVRRVEPFGVDLQDPHRLVDRGQGHAAVAVDLRVVPDALEQPVHDARGRATASGDGRRGVVRDLEAEDRGGSVDDGAQVLFRVEVEAVDRPEAVAQRPADPTGTRGRAHDRERPQGEAQRACRRPLADHHVERAVLHGRVEDLLHRPVEPVDLVDEEDVALVEGGKDGGEVPCPLDRRPRRVADVHAQLAGDDRGEGGLAEPGRTVKENVVGRLATLLSGLEQDREARLHLSLAYVLVERPRPQGALDRDLLLVEEVRREESVAVRHRPESTMPVAYFARMFEPPRRASAAGKGPEGRLHAILERARRGAGRLGVAGGRARLRERVAERLERADHVALGRPPARSVSYTHLP